MIGLLRAAAVIARRDYVATVWSRTFLFFLLAPVLPVVFGGVFAALSAPSDAPAEQRPVIVLGDAGLFARLQATRLRLAGALGDDAIPPLRRAPAEQNPAAQAQRLLADPDRPPLAVLSGPLDRPALTAGRSQIDRLDGPLALLIDQTRAAEALGAAAPPPVTLVRHVSEIKAGSDHRNGRANLARSTQFALFVLTIMLAGMLISNLVEEKSNKIIEILAAAVPVDAIFLGKLFAMLAVSLTGLTVWGGVAAVAGGLLLPPTALATPAVGWPMFVLLGIIYFASVYLLLGALYLGVGAQAASVREVQTLSLPLTMGQLVIFALASATIDRPDGWAGRFAVVFPWSSPYAMLSRAAQRPSLWPHLLALAWQIVCLALIVRLAARMFRRSVLKSGGGISLFARK